MRISFQTFNFVKQNKLKSSPYMTSCALQRPLASDVFEKIAVDNKVNNTNISFGSIVCSKSAFKIRDIENLRCPICENIMLNDSQVEEFRGNVYDKKGKSLINALDKYGKEAYWTGGDTNSNRTIFNPKKQEIVDTLRILAAENPNSDLSALVKIKAEKCFSDLLEKETSVLDELTDFVIINVKDINEKMELLDIIDEAQTKARQVGPDAFKRKKFLYAIKDKVSNRRVQDDMDKIANKLPTSIDDTSAFFVKYSKENRKNAEIARVLAGGNIPTAEHLTPHSDNGEDILENYLCDCADCNSTRMSTPFDTWIKGMPHIEENLQRHVSEVQEHINNGEFDTDYDFYVNGLIKTLSSLSNGEIELEVPQLDEKILDRRRQKHIQIDEEMNQINDRLTFLTKEIERLKEEKAVAEPDKRQELTSQIGVLRRESDILFNKLIHLRTDRKTLVAYSEKYNFEF